MAGYDATLPPTWIRRLRYAPVVTFACVMSCMCIVFGATLFTATAFAASDKPITIVAFGDSLTAGFGLNESDAFPSRLEAELKKRGHNVAVSNAGVSGDTTTAGLARFDWAIADDTDAVILELGANDALRGQSPERARANLTEIMRRLSERSIPVLIAGMHAPTNWGAAYAKEFDTIFPDLAETYDAILYPFFLEGVALKPELNLKDGMHPNADGVAEIVRRILPDVERLITRAAERRTKS